MRMLCHRAITPIVVFLTFSCSPGKQQEPSPAPGTSATAKPAAQTPPQVSVETPKPAAVSAPPVTKRSAAREWASSAKAALDTTTLEQFMSQIPDGIQPAAERVGTNRRFTLTFSDSSQIIATFRPRGGEGSGAGLILHMVDIKE